jgi:hypothetical protein
MRGRTLHVVVPVDAPIRRLLALVELPRFVEMHADVTEVAGRSR